VTAGALGVWPVARQDPPRSKNCHRSRLASRHVTVLILSHRGWLSGPIGHNPGFQVAPARAPESASINASAKECRKPASTNPSTKSAPEEHPSWATNAVSQSEISPLFLRAAATIQPNKCTSPYAIAASTVIRAPSRAPGTMGHGGASSWCTGRAPRSGSPFMPPAEVCRADLERYVAIARALRNIAPVPFGIVSSHSASRNSSWSSGVIRGGSAGAIMSVSRSTDRNRFNASRSPL
jgi:hypothetical protein